MSIQELNFLKLRKLYTACFQKCGKFLKNLRPFGLIALMQLDRVVSVFKKLDKVNCLLGERSEPHTGVFNRDFA